LSNSTYRAKERLAPFNGDILILKNELYG